MTSGTASTACNPSNNSGIITAPSNPSNNTSTITGKPIGEEQADVHPSAVGPEPDLKKKSTTMAAKEEGGGDTTKAKAKTESMSETNTEGSAGKHEDAGEGEGGEHPSDLGPDGYPPQRHAGKVGLGPEYGQHKGEGFGAKITGIKEQIKGKLTRNPDLVEKGHERITGELQQKEREAEDAKSPFGGSKKKAEGNDEGDANAHPNEAAKSDTPSADKAMKEQAASTHPEGTEKGNKQAAEGHTLGREAGKEIDHPTS